MSIAILLAIILITYLMGILKYKKATFLCFSLMFIYLFAVGCGIVPSFLLARLQTTYPPLQNPEWSTHNLIVVLGGGTVKIPGSNIVQPTVLSYSRIYEAAKLYTACKQSGHECTIIISGGDVTKTGVPEAIAYSKALMAIGVNTSDIKLESHSMNTYQNAKFCKEIIKALNSKKIFLVTSGFHTKRSLLLFSHFGIEAIAAPSDYLSVRWSSVPLAYNFTLNDIALHEYIGILQFYIYNSLG